jgi:hypothetical protein
VTATDAETAQADALLALKSAVLFFKTTVQVRSSKL